MKPWVPVIVWMAAIFIFSSNQRIAVSEEQVINFIVFKTLHVSEYAILYLLCYRAIRSTWPGSARLWHVASFLLSIGYAVTDEIHQMFVPTREGRARDVIIDAIGAGIIWISLVKLLPKAPRRLRAWVRALGIG
ncbi:VanZ family protein [Patescibacteria group bacterium]|nr:VanZ family protein [Patescibacteria group bacterium]MBU1472726.1 VanZ family protein [Patescibacteria group bacterium]MBU2459993.1 VanZ family protein [Patescibacteria group bacterium]MBU2544349.1 VanZ family protein [Patescibacteria group bacterium]